MAASLASPAQSSLPATPGETLSGKHIVLAEAIHGRPVILLAGFSKEGGMRCADWVKAIHGDLALAGVDLYQVSMLGGAPSLLRPMIKSAMRKGLSQADQDRFVVLTADEKLWRDAFGVTTDADPWVMEIDAAGRVVWHGHGAAASLEPLLAPALPHAGQR